jgi:hypothetical protein
MALSDFTELKAAVERWLWDRADLTATVPEFIRLCEAQMTRALNVREMERVVTLHLVDGEAKLPCDFAEVRSIREPGNERLELKAVPLSTILERRDMQNPYMAEYAVGGNKLYVWPRKEGEVVMHYRARLVNLSDDYPENWLLEKHPDAYLYGSLMQAAPYLQEDERIGVWAGLYQNAIAGINEDGRRARIGAQVAMQPNGAVV